MGKTRKDKEYERGVHDGQEGGFFDDAMQGMTQEGSPYDKGYKYGAEHRHSWKERYPSWEPKTSLGEKKARKTAGSYDPYFHGSDNPRSYKIEGWGEDAGSEAVGIVLKIIGIVFLIYVAAMIVTGIDSYNEKAKRLDQKSKIQEKAGNIRGTANLNGYLTKWIEGNFLPGYKKAEIDKRMQYHHFGYRKQGDNIKIIVAVPLRIDDYSICWEHFMCLSSDNGAIWKIQWIKRDGLQSRR